MQQLLLSAAGLAILVASGLLHGLWTDRWSDQSDLATAAAALTKVPANFGNWHGEDIEVEKDERSGLAGSIARRYTNTANGKVVTLFLACGRPGPVGTHTPDVCYGSSGYNADPPRRFQLASDSAQAPPEFWTARFVRQRSDGQSSLRIFWGWLTRAGWKTADNPRLAFAGEHILHKMYVIRETHGDEPVERDPSVEFIQDLLPELSQVLYHEAQ